MFSAFKDLLRQSQGKLEPGGKASSDEAMDDTPACSLSRLLDVDKVYYICLYINICIQICIYIYIDIYICRYIDIQINESIDMFIETEGGRERERQGLERRGDG